MDATNTIESFSGTFKVGDYTINRLGFGSMRLTGRGVWGPPADIEQALATLRRAPELGINFIDTADSYGPDVAEELIGKALVGRKDILVATKAGLRRPGPDQWVPHGRPEYLIERAKGSLKKLGVERIGLWQLHRIDPRVPMQDQFAAIRQLLDEGVIANAGLSEVSISEIEIASRYFKVATVQNRYNLVDRGSEDVLDYCEQNGIGFIPWFPLAAGDLARPGGVLDSLAKQHAATPGQIALAWMLKRSPVMLPIPGTSKVTHLEQNVAAARIQLSADEFHELDQSVR
ncbi:MULTISPECIES: aldo/keto reductase [unclassified Rhizobium]|uniref:aldo/keto reductase n=1 Tax=unclassified Rhizobium TaxID=2613769 RepID=UPI00144738F2|nr:MULTISPECIES: aldo/keto reductase [unclassified Rhizobium]NKJ07916.1 aryl-alcohol dehydrogenase-like predicted oxidoreductase [Rhizobium sp. SG741]NKJ36842.1 aryl-alcohol dehydrogenase-like predicted oxidoreductase [Rhizobium sp. SG570]